MEALEDFGANDDRRVYRMPQYYPIRASEHKTAWKLLKRLMEVKDEAWRVVVNEQLTPKRMQISDIGYMVNQRVCDAMREPGNVAIPETLVEALDELERTAGMYGACYVFEFSRRNCMVDSNGTLVLLDPLFSLEAVEAMRVAKRKKAGY